jgi:class 3 adenylate cyclase
MPAWAPIRYAHNGDVSIAYSVAGEGPIDLLVITGFVSHLEIGVTLPLAERFWDRVSSFARVIFFDKRGMGLSDRDGGAYTLENITDDALAVLDAVGVERAAVFGISEGGSAATMLAATHPERVSAMVQYATYARVSRAPDYAEGIPVEVTRRLWDRMLENWGDPRMANTWAPSLAGDPELLDWWGRLLRSGASPGTVRAIEHMYAELDVRPLLAAVRTPTLILYRAGDRLIPPVLSRTVARGIPDAREVELPGRDHLVFVDHDRLVDEMEEFLTGRPAVVASDRVLATVLFTDLVGSTRRAAELGDRRWRALLEQHERMCRRELDRYRGRLVKSTGDGLLATFDGPARAVRAAVAMRDAARSAGLELRAGVHTGECEILGDDLAGMAVHIASRVEGTAPAGEVVVSSTVKDLVVGSGLMFEDRGTHELKGVPDKWRLYKVIRDSDSSRQGPAGGQHEPIVT